MILIRAEAPQDRGRSLEIEREAFGRPDEAEIVAAVRDLDGSFALVAEDEGSIVGHVQLSRASIGQDGVLALGPIGVVVARQREGIGSSLVRAALEAARERGEIAVILLGSQEFYPRFGFRPGSSIGLRNPYAGRREQDFMILEDDLMVAVLDDQVRSLAGAIRWHRAFGAPVEADEDPR